MSADPVSGPDLSAALAAAVRAGDPERFAATMLASPALRVRLWPVYALNLELARAPWAAQNPLLGEMRLQWWADQIRLLADPPPHAEPPREPSLQALAPSLPGSPRLVAALEDLAETRRADCDPTPFADVTGWLAYLDGTAGAVMRAAAAVLGADDAALLRPFWRAQGMAAFLRAVPGLRARGHDPLARLGADELAAQAGDARRALLKAPRPDWPLRAAALGATGAAAVLARAAGDPARVAAGDLAGSEFGRRAGLLWAGLTGRLR